VMLLACQTPGPAPVAATAGQSSTAQSVPQPAAEATVASAPSAMQAPPSAGAIPSASAFPRSEAVQPARARRPGKVYTVSGAIEALHTEALVLNERAEARVIGVIAKVNYDDIPACAVHPTAEADPEGCSSPFPSFWLASNSNDGSSDRIPVVGWASDAANLYEAMQHFDSGNPEPHVDLLWGQAMPRPLPAVGAEVVVSGFYGTGFRMSIEVPLELRSGIITYTSLEYVKQAPNKAQFPWRLGSSGAE
jgi:hypothetical protein